jgi:hypothetical protein
VVASLASAPKIARSGVRITYPAVGRVARGFTVVESALSKRMDAEDLGFTLQDQMSPGDRYTIRCLLFDFQHEILTREECLEAIAAVRAYGSAQQTLI